MLRTIHVEHTSQQHEIGVGPGGRVVEAAVRHHTPWIVADKEYMKRGATALAKYGGRVVVRGAVEVLQGEPPGCRVAILEFPAAEQADAWWNSPDRTGAREFRIVSSEGKAYLVPGDAGG